MPGNLSTIAGDAQALVCAPPVIVVTFPGTSPLPLTTFLVGLGYAVHHTLADLTGPAGTVSLGDGAALVVSAPDAQTLAARPGLRSARRVVLTRDPRDALCGLLGGPLGQVSHAGDDVADNPTWEWQSQGMAAVDVVATQIQALRAWCRQRDPLKVRYEDVCPPQLGGDEATQIRSLLGFAALVGWRGSGFTLTRALLACQAPSGWHHRQHEVGTWQRLRDTRARDAIQAALLDQVLAWDYPVSPPPVRLTAPGELAGLFGVLVQEHDQRVGALSQRVADARIELGRVEDAARRLQGKLADERQRLHLVKRGLSLLATCRSGLRSLVSPTLSSPPRHGQVAR